jgi:RNA-directed DNA polymerase
MRSTGKLPKGSLNLAKRGGKAPTAGQQTGQRHLFFETAESPRGNNAGRERVKAASRPSGLPKSKNREGEDWSAMVTLEEVGREGNLREAFRRVKANKGAPGPDRQTIATVEKNLEDLLPKLSRSLLEETYEPGMMRRKWLPKPGGGERGLGIPDVVDRMVGQALELVLGPLYEPTFHPNSHGFRRGRSCHTAIATAVQYLEEGCEWVVDLDLEKFFDRVNHDRLMAQLAQQIGDKRVLRLIRAFLKAGVLEDGLVGPVDEGTPQGGPLSPLLSNIVLDELDRELERRGLRFARYADDCNVYVRSRRAGERVMESIKRFLAKRLRLKVNEQKSAVARPWERKFLGFSFTNAGIAKRRIAPKAVERFKKRVRELTKRTRGVSKEQMAEELARYLRGWLGYFGKCETPSVLERLEQWTRRRLRSAIWKQWARGPARFAELRKRGVSQHLAAQTVGSAHGPWRLADSPGLHRALPNAYFDSLGIPRLTCR